MIDMCPGQILSVQLNGDEQEVLNKAGYEYVEGTLVPQPIARPKFTLSELRNAIPAHCFERSLVKSFGYLLFDIVIITTLLHCAYAVLEKQSLPHYLQFIGYLIYWFIQGSFMFGIWVLAHECGMFLIKINSHSDNGVTFHSFEQVHLRIGENACLSECLKSFLFNVFLTSATNLITTGKKFLRYK